MTRLDAETTELLAEPEAPADLGPRWLLLESREVPLGGVRGMEVHRSLPQRDLPMVGAWCFLDRFGPQHDPHARRAASAHRTADRHLAVRRRDPSPRQRRQ